MPYVIFIVFAALIIIGAIYGHLQSQKRREELRSLSQQHGWDFSEARDGGFEARYPAFACLQKGSDRYAYNILEGPVPQGRVCGFDYHYETESTDSEGRTQTQDHHFSGLLIETNLPLKPLLIRPENFFDKIGEFFGYDGIDFESDEFSRKFCVKAEDRRWAFDVIHQSTMEFLLAAPRFTIQFAGSAILAHSGGVFDATEYEQALQVVSGIIDRLPEYLLRELKGVQ